MSVEERSLTSRGVRKRGKAWLLARAYQSHYVSETPECATRESEGGTGLPVSRIERQDVENGFPYGGLGSSTP